MRRRGVPKPGVKLRECSMCNEVWELAKLRSRGGGLRCPKCYDQPNDLPYRRTTRRLP